MAILFEETYGTLAASTALTSSNTIYDLLSGSGTYTAVTDGVRGSAGRFATAATASTAQARAQLGSLRSSFYARFYFRVNTLPVASGITMYAARSATTFRADIRLNPTGSLSIRDQSVSVATSTALVATSTWHRAEWHWNQAGNAQELRVWLGSNRDSTGTADIILTGAAGGGTADNTIRGVCTSTASTSLDIDDDRADDTTWIGPSSQPPPADVGDLFDVTYGTLAGGTTLTAGNTGYTAISVGTGATATAVTDGVRSSAGRYAVTTTSTTAQARTDLAAVETELYWRLYVRIPSNPTVTTTLAMIADAGAVDLADVRVLTDGTLELRNISGATDVSTAALTPNVWHRLEWRWDQTGGAQELRMWLGANLHGDVTQTETLTTVVTGSSPASALWRGICSAKTSWNVDVDDDKASDTTWVGPSVVPVGAALLREGFEAGAPPAALTSANTDFDGVLFGGTGTGTATFDASNFASGAQSGRLVSLAGDTVILRHDLSALTSVYWWREYRTLAALPGVITTLAEAKVAATSTIRGQVQVNTSGTLRLRNVTTLVGTTSAAVAAGQMFRLEWSLNTTTGQQRLRLFAGGNVHGTDPDEEISGALAAGNTFDRIDAGHLTTGALTSYMDEAETSDTDWVGPTATPTTPAGTVFTGVGLPIFTTPGAPPPPPPGGSELDSLYRPAGGKIIWGAVPAAMGTMSINPANLAALESMTGRRMDTVRVYKSQCTQTCFAANSNERVMGVGDAVGGRLVSMTMKSSPFTNQEVIDGAADATLNTRATEIAAYGLPVLFGFHHEPEGPNGEDMPAATWRLLQLKVLPFFRARCPNIRTAVNVMGFAGNNDYVRAAWPANDTAMEAVIDWIGLDPYTFRSSGGTPQALSSILNDALTNWAHTADKVNKPIALFEWGCADDPTGQNGVAITDAGAGKSAWFDAAGAWMRDNALGQRIKLSTYYHSPGTVATTPVNSTYNGYTATSPTRSSSPTANSLEAWKRISAFPRTVVNLGF